MSVAEQLGLDQVDGPMLARARAWWRTTTIAEQIGVGDLIDIPAWTRRARRTECDLLLGWLAERALDDEDAAVVLVWLLMPGAARIADRYRDLSPDIDQLVAGQLWLEARTHGGTPAKAVAFTILQRTKRAVLADLGVGDGAQRQDRAWANTTVTDRIVDREMPVAVDEFDAADELRLLISTMLRDGALTPDEAGLLSSATAHADWIEAPLRGRAGVTAPGALEILTWLEQSKARTMRRTIGLLLERVGSYAREHGTLDDTDALRRARANEWSFGEMVMIARNPDMEGRLRRFHHDLRNRCPAQREVQADGTDRCPCSEHCDVQDGVAAEVASA